MSTKPHAPPQLAYTANNKARIENNITYIYQEFALLLV